MILIWVILICTVVFDAIGDAYVFVGRMTRGKFFQAMMVASFLGVAIIAHHLPPGILSWPGLAYLVLMYVLIRGGLFNPIWGYFGIRLWYYLGTTSYFDRMLLWITNNIKWKGKIIFIQQPFLIIVYSFSFLLSVGVLFQYFLS
jgi:hypothetical protein